MDVNKLSKSIKLGTGIKLVVRRGHISYNLTSYIEEKAIGGKANIHLLD